MSRNSMSRKRRRSRRSTMTNWDQVAWTPFVHATIPDDQMNRVDPPSGIVVNSRYQVTVYLRAAEPFGNIVHLSIKTHDRSARHDWRDLQRIKNEIVGPEYDAVEVYPAESKMRGHFKPISICESFLASRSRSAFRRAY